MRRRRKPTAHIPQLRTMRGRKIRQALLNSLDPIRMSREPCRMIGESGRMSRQPRRMGGNSGGMMGQRRRLPV